MGRPALEQFTGGNEVHLIPRPVITGVDEVLGIIHDLHGGTAVHGELDTILGGQGVLDDLLGAIRMDKHGHRARLHIGDRNLHLGLACTLGYFDVRHGRGIGIPGGLDLNRGLHRLAVLLGLGLDLGAVGLGGGLHLSGAAGIVTVRGRTATRGRSAGGLGLNGQRVNGVQSFLWRKGNSAEAGVVDRPPRCPLPVVELCQRIDDLAVA